MYDLIPKFFTKLKEMNLCWFILFVHKSMLVYFICSSVFLMNDRLPSYN